MTFAVPLFLFAALAGIVPVVLHMINRQKAKDLPFPTLRFLKISSQKTKRRRRIQDVFLMLVRLAALLLIALGLSKPTVTNLRSLFSGGANTAVAIVLDNSASMGVVDSDRVRMDSALDAANQIMEQLQEGDQAALFVTNGVPFPEAGKLDRGQDQVRQMLAQCHVTYERADVGAKVAEARNLLAKTDMVNKYLFVISDFQALSFESLKKELADHPAEPPPAGPQPPLSKVEQEKRDLPIICVDLARAPKPNVAVQKVQLEAAMPIAGLPIKATATLYNASVEPQDRRVELWIDELKEGVSSDLHIPPRESVRAEFIFRFKSGGLHKGEVRLANDESSKLDDRRFFTMEVDQGIPVGVVKASGHEIPYLEDTYYVEKALGQGRAGNWALRSTPMLAAQLATDPLGTFKVLFCVNLPAPDDASADKLRAYVEHGGNLFWICGDNVTPESYNTMNQHAAQALLPAPLLDIRTPAPGDGKDFWRIGGLDKEYTPLATLAEPPSLFQSVLVYKHMRMDVSKGGNSLRVLARLEDGEPLMVQRKVGKGTVTMLGTSGHVNWTNFPVRPIFLPMLAQMTFFLSGTVQARHEGIAGVPITLQFIDEIRPTVVEVLPPSGETIRRNLQEEGLPPDQPFRYNDTHDIGIYMLRLLQGVSPRLIPYSVNIDPDEAKSEKIPCADLEKAYPNPYVFAGFADDSTVARGKKVQDLAEAYQWLRQGSSLWGLFLTCVLCVLVFETLISNMFSPKQDDQQLQKVAPGLRRLAKKGRAQPAAERRS